MREDPRMKQSDAIAPLSPVPSTISADRGFSDREMVYSYHSDGKDNPAAQGGNPSSSSNFDIDKVTNSEEEDHDWEEWNPAKISFVNHMIAGSVAGLAEHVSMFPIDTIKTHIQYDRSAPINPIYTWKSTSRIIRKQGFARLWRGVSAMFAGCIPAHAAYFSVFEASKVLLGANGQGHFPIQAAACGAIAAVAHDLFMTPFDMVKQRMQLGFYKNLMHCLKCIIRTEGIMGFYVALPTTLMMNIPHAVVLVPVNESVRKFLNPTDQYNFSASMLAGSAAGTVAAAITTPLDVIKTRLQTQNLEPAPSSVKPSFPSIMRASNSVLRHTSHPSARVLQTAACLHGREIGLHSSSRAARSNVPYGGIRTENTCRGCAAHSQMARLSPHWRGMQVVVQRIIAEDGMKGFLRGMIPRMLVNAPSAAISWTAYEAMKSVLAET